MLVRTDYCPVCGLNTTHHNTQCVVCAERIKRVERAQWLALTSEEKIEVLLKRIEHLEQSNVRY